MKIIQGITDTANQTLVLTLEDGSRATLVLEYREQQQGWFYDLTYGDFVSSGNRLVTGPNILRQYRDLIPFGLLVDSVNQQEPQIQTVFLDGLTSIYLLNEMDVVDVELTIFIGS